MKEDGVTKQTLTRLPEYLNYIKGLKEEKPALISASAIAKALSLSDVVVRKDLAAVCDAGRPKVGYPLEELRDALETFLGYRDVSDAVLVGAGKLGRALLGYEGFKALGLNILAAFDLNAGESENGVPVFPVSRVTELCARMRIRIGVITTPAAAAQAACDALVAGGVLAVWNFAPAHLTVPRGILVQNENMAASLAILSKHLEKNLD